LASLWKVCSSLFAAIAIGESGSKAVCRAMLSIRSSERRRPFGAVQGYGLRRAPGFDRNCGIRDLAEGADDK
jgi:hypothetical protein